jgi:hypothetical protein
MLYPRNESDSSEEYREWDDANRALHAAAAARHRSRAQLDNTPLQDLLEPHVPDHHPQQPFLTDLPKDPEDFVHGLLRLGAAMEDPMQARAAPIPPKVGGPRRCRAPRIIRQAPRPAPRAARLTVRARRCRARRPRSTRTPCSASFVQRVGVSATSRSPPRLPAPPAPRASLGLRLQLALRRERARARARRSRRTQRLPVMQHRHSAACVLSAPAHAGGAGARRAPSTSLGLERPSRRYHARAFQPLSYPPTAFFAPNRFLIPQPPAPCTSRSPVARAWR